MGAQHKLLLYNCLALLGEERNIPKLIIVSSYFAKSKSQEHKEKEVQEKEQCINNCPPCHHAAISIGLISAHMRAIFVKESDRDY
jgi:hypothetical protein